MGLPRERPPGRILLLIAGALFWLGIMTLVNPDAARTKDRWRREGLADRFSAGEASRPLLLANAADVAVFAEIRCAEWAEPRPELLLSGESQLIDVPSDPTHPTEVRMRTLDLQVPGTAHVVQLPEGWVKTFIDVDEDGSVTDTTSAGGDYWPKRGYVAVDSVYPLPVRVELPYDAHERPSTRSFERNAWIGPGVRWDSTQCAYALDRVPSVTIWVPQLTDNERVLEISAADSATRLTMQPDGTVDRDAIPVWRRLAQVAGF